MNSRHKTVRPRLERLESRENPTLTTSFVAATHTLTVIGDPSGNDLTLHGDAADSTKLTLTSIGSFAGAGAGPFTGVGTIKITMLGGDNDITFDNTVPIDLEGSLTINAGTGRNTVTATDLTVEKNFSITNAHTIQFDSTALTNLNVGGSLTIVNGGASQTSISRDSAGESRIVGNLKITNGTGEDTNLIADTDIGGNVTINNGQGNPQGFAGQTVIQNSFNTASRSVIGGNVSVSYLNRPNRGSDVLGDVEVFGNVNFSHTFEGSGIEFDGVATSLQDIIRGGLSIGGTGGNTVVTVGTYAKHTGLLVGKNLTMKAGAGPDSLTARNLEVDGRTSLQLGDGINHVTIDDSMFVGAFSLTTGKDFDIVNLDTTAGTNLPTIFEGSVTISLGARNDTLNREGNTDAGQSLVIYRTFVVHGGDVQSSNLNQELFPFGGSIQWLK